MFLFSKKTLLNMNFLLMMLDQCLTVKYIKNGLPIEYDFGKEQLCY